MRPLHQVWAGFASTVLEFVQRADGDEATLRAQAGLTPVQLADPRQMVGAEQTVLLLESAASMLDDTALGLHVAECFEFGVMGPFSYAVMNAPRFGTALRNIERYATSLADGTPPDLVIDGETTRLRFQFAADLDPVTIRQLIEAGALIFVRMMRALGGKDWQPTEVCFRHPPPPDTREHRRLFRAAVHFNRPADCIAFATSDLERRVAGADRFLLPIAERELREIVSEPADADPWRRELEMFVASRICDGPPTLRALAPQLGLSVRTLQRRLEERGLSYRRLVADVRMQIACHYLEETETALGEIAFLLGYSELSAFDHAFRGWMHRSPREYRTQKRGPSSGR